MLSKSVSSLCDFVTAEPGLRYEALFTSYGWAHLMTLLRIDTRGLPAKESDLFLKYLKARLEIWT